MTLSDLTHTWTVVAYLARGADRWDWDTWDATAIIAARDAGQITTAQRRNSDGSTSLVAMLCRAAPGRSTRPPRQIPPQRAQEAPRRHPEPLAAHVMRRVREGATHARIAAEMGMTPDQVSGVVRRVKGRAW